MTQSSLAPAVQAAVLILLVCLMGCAREPEKAHWVAKRYLDGTDWQLVCDSGGRIIAGASNPDTSLNGNWSVYGGDGAMYGDYADETDAKARAEWVTRRTSFLRGGNLNHCE